MPVQSMKVLATEIVGTTILMLGGPGSGGRGDSDQAGWIRTGWTETGLSRGPT